MRAILLCLLLSGAWSADPVIDTDALRRQVRAVALQAAKILQANGFAITPDSLSDQYEGPHAYASFSANVDDREMPGHLHEVHYSFWQYPAPEIRPGMLFDPPVDYDPAKLPPAQPVQWLLPKYDEALAGMRGQRDDPSTGPWPKTWLDTQNPGGGRNLGIRGYRSAVRNVGGHEIMVDGHFEWQEFRDEAPLRYGMPAIVMLRRAVTYVAVARTGGGLVAKVQGSARWYHHSDPAKPGEPRVNVAKAEAMPDLAAWPSLDLLLSGLAGMPGPAHMAATRRLAISAAPSTLPLDGRCTAALSLRGPAGVAVSVRIQPEDGGVPGTLSATSATLDAQGEARLVFTAAEAAAFTKPPRQAKIFATAGDLTDEVNIAFEQTAFRCDAQPRYAGADHAVMPADRRFPAELRFSLRNPDRNDEPLAKEPLRLRIAAGAAELALLGPAAADGRRAETGRGATLEAETDAAGEVVLRVAWTGPKPDGPAPVVVEAEAPRRNLRGSARILAGLDLHLVGAQVAARQGAGNAAISAGEPVPLAIALVDPFHPDIRDLTPVLGWWQEGGMHGEHSLLIDVAIGYGAEVPQYLTDLLGADRRRQPFRELCVARYDAARGCTVPMAVDGAIGLPRVQVATSGLNSFEILAHLATVVAGPAGRASEMVAEPLEKNNWAVAQLRAGVQADAAYIFLVENPFRPGSAEGELLRRIASLNGGASAIFTLSDAVDAINRCDWEDIAAVAADQVVGKLVSGYADRLELIKKMSPAARTAALRELAKEQVTAKVYHASQLAVFAGIGSAALQVGAKQIDAALVAGSAAGSAGHLTRFADRLDEVVQDAAGFATLPFKLVTVSAGGGDAPVLRDQASGAPLAWEEGRLRFADDGSATLKCGPLLLAAVPAERRLQAVGGDLREHALAGPPRREPSVEHAGRGPRFAEPRAEAARQRLDDSLRGAEQARIACRADLLRADLARLDAALASAPADAQAELRRRRQTALAELHRLTVNARIP